MRVGYVESTLRWTEDEDINPVLLHRETNDILTCFVEGVILAISSSAFTTRCDKRTFLSLIFKICASVFDVTHLFPTATIPAHITCIPSRQI